MFLFLRAKLYDMFLIFIVHRLLLWFKSCFQC